ncbi:MAG: glycosidase [Candidatus Marinimicrobia bacterium]|nr:glycosidase [Candidatus Neomarinimicrobiota bacterium]
MKLTRLTKEPILKPIKNHPWERSAVFNAGAVYHNGLYHMIYRATDIGGSEKYGEYINSLGYAVSSDLLKWHRYDKPILTNDVPQELRGPEDPRIVKMNDTFIMTYTGFGGRFENDYRICMATSTDLVHWARKGVLLDEPNKDAALFPEKIGGRYCMFHRRHTDIWLCYSDDMLNWTGHQKIMAPIPGTWNQSKIGIGGPPVKVEEGWFLIFHGVDEHHRYCLGAVLLDYTNPGKVLARQTEPIIEPTLDWEVNGYIPNVIFSNATVLKDKRIFCLYGGADTVIGVAYIDLKDVVFENDSWIV